MVSFCPVFLWNTLEAEFSSASFNRSLAAFLAAKSEEEGLAREVMAPAATFRGTPDDDGFLAAAAAAPPAAGCGMALD